MSRQTRDYLSRSWRPKWAEDPHYRRIAEAHNRVLELCNALPEVEANGQKLKDGGEHSAKGLVERQKELAAARVVPLVAGARNALERTRRDLQAARASLRLPSPDPSDAAAAIRRMEYRTWLRSLNPGEAALALSDPEAPAEMLMAAAEMPAPMLGLTPAERAQLEADFIERTYPEDLALIADMEEAASVIAGALEIATPSIGEALGLDLRDPEQSYEFTAWMSEKLEPLKESPEAHDGPVVIQPRQARAVAEVINGMSKDQLDRLSDFVLERKIAAITGGADARVPLPEFA